MGGGAPRTRPARPAESSWVTGAAAVTRRLCPQEKRDKAALQAELRHLRRDNRRLQQESQTATAQLRRFTQWLLHAVDKAP